MSSEKQMQATELKRLTQLLWFGRVGTSNRDTQPFTSFLQQNLP